MSEHPTLAAKRADQAWAQSYDEDVNPTRDLDALCLRQAPLVLAGKRVLELGAGTGKNTQWLAAEAAHVMALDLSPAMLARARSHLGDAPSVDFIEHDITRPWPVATAGVDGVIANLVLEHIADLAPVFAEARRVLGPGGIFYLSELHPWRQWRGSQARIVEQGKTRLVEAYLHNTADYLQAAVATGFSLVAIEEPIEAGRVIDAQNPPRLLTLLFQREAEPSRA